MKNKNTKIILSLLILALMVGGFLGFTGFLKGEDGEKIIIISITNKEDNNEIMKEKAFRTTKETLGDFLEENKSELEVIMRDSQYGRFLEGLVGFNTESMMDGPWWMYSYESKSQNINMEIGNAPGVDDLGLFDGDKIHFVFTSDMDF